MDKFGRRVDYNTNEVDNRQILVPNHYLRLDGTTAMQADIDLGSNNIINISNIKPMSADGDIKLHGSMNMNNGSLKNVQTLSASQGNSIQIGSTIDLKGYQIINPKVPESDNALASIQMVRDNFKIRRFLHISK